MTGSDNEEMQSQGGNNVDNKTEKSNHNNKDTIVMPPEKGEIRYSTNASDKRRMSNSPIDDCQSSLDVYNELSATYEDEFSPGKYHKQNFKCNKYKEYEMNYLPNQTFKRYNPSLKHFIPYRSSKESQLKMPVDSTGMFSFITFSWMTNFMWRAYKNGINREDIPLCSPYDMCKYNTQRLQLLWNEEVKNKGLDDASLQHVIWRFIRTRILISLTLFIITLVLGFFGPTIFMRNLIDWLSTDEPMSKGFLWAFGLFISEFFRIIIFGLVFAISYRTGIRLRAACMGLVYNKLMTISNAGDKSIGEIINLFANDSQRLFDFVVLGPLIVGGPIVAVGGVIYVLCILGPWALFGMLTFALFYPFQYVISRVLGYLRRKTILVTDERVRMMNELLSCVRLIKMYAWEKSFADTIADIRLREKRLLEKCAYVQSISLAMAPTVPVIAAIITFTSHIGAGFNLTAAEALTIVAVCLGHMRRSIMMMSTGVRTIMDSTVVIERLKSILSMREVEKYIENINDDKTVISMKQVTLAWYLTTDKKKKYEKKKRDNSSIPAADQSLLSSSQETNTVDVLFDIDISVKKGELIGICGSVGSGKSSLISGLLSQMHLKSGKVALEGSCGYVGQQPWILNTSLRDNVLLGEVFEAKEYYKVMHACNLLQDISSLPAGDATEIGERGINLSGGQKQRLSLARALYSNKDIYFLDDPLSAVDIEVGQHIFKWVIKDVLKDKTTIFVTHQMQYLTECDRILFMKDGRIAECGTHQELIELNLDYAALYQIHLDSSKTIDNTKETTLIENLKNKDGLIGKSSKFILKNDKIDIDQNKPKKLQENNGSLVNEEKLEKGDIDGSTYHSYIKYCGGYAIAALVLSTFIVNIGSTAFSSWWLSYWLSAGSGNVTIYLDSNVTITSDNIADNPDMWYYQLVYSLMILVILGSSLIRGFSFMKVTIRASTKMHQLVFHRIFRSPMSFFETTPSGQIINIFSRDVDEIDVRLPMTMETFIQNIGIIFSSLLFVCLIFPYFIVMLIVLAVIFLFIRNIFRKGIRDLKRIENVSRSPLFSHISTTVNGLTTINAYQKQQIFQEKFEELFDDSSSAFYLFHCAMRWLAIRLDLLALMIVACTAILTVLLKGNVETAFAGLALAYAAQLSGIFQYTVRLSTETEARFTSVERINNYIKYAESEAPTIIEASAPKYEWPKYGRICFKNVEMRYRSETPLVLKRISIEIESEEKIGVVGRTGSGKSSLGVALFRLVELSGGTITIDNVDISGLGLETLRSKISIIPQDPVLFIGTIRYNLDPFNKHNDEEVWNALEKTFMKDSIAALPLNLMSPVVENGENFSLGERQLLCMARALLRNTKILFLDEATAAIDTETDSKIQKTLQTVFKNCTTITIAHRLNTIVSSSRVLVMKDGEVVEFDSPDKLLSNNNSVFSKMLAQANIKNTR